MICILIYQNLERPSSPEPKVELQAYRKPSSSIIIQIKLLALYSCEQEHYINILLLCHLKYGCFLAGRLQKQQILPKYFTTSWGKLTSFIYILNICFI